MLPEPDLYRTLIGTTDYPAQVSVTQRSDRSAAEPDTKIVCGRSAPARLDGWLRKRSGICAAIAADGPAAACLAPPAASPQNAGWSSESAPTSGPDRRQPARATAMDLAGLAARYAATQAN